MSTPTGIDYKDKQAPMLWHRATQWLAGLRPVDWAPIVPVAVVGATSIVLSAGTARGITHLVLLSLTLAESSIALLFRRRHPIGALAGVVAVYLVFDLPPTMALPVLVALFTVATMRSGRVLVVATAATVALLTARPYVGGGTVDFLSQQVPILAATGLTVALGLYQRLRRATVRPKDGDAERLFRPVAPPEANRHANSNTWPSNDQPGKQEAP